jgi:YVTN family beta-propeller protein
MLRLAATVAMALAFAPAEAKDTGLIYVSNEKSNNILVVDPKTYKVVNDIAVSRRPRDMHFNADHSKLYIACGDDDVIDVLAIIDMDRNIVEKEVQTGAEPEGVLVSADGKTVYVTSEVGDLVHAIDADRGYVTQDVVVGTRPRRFAATPDGKELWVSTEMAGEVYIVDRQKFVVTGKIDFLPPGMRKSDVTPVGLVMTKDGKTAYVTLGHAAHVAVVDVPTRAVQGYILVGKRSWGVTLSRDEKTLYVANGLGDDITIIDTASRKAVISIPVGRVPWGIVVDD